MALNTSVSVTLRFYRNCTHFTKVSMSLVRDDDVTME